MGFIFESSSKLVFASIIIKNFSSFVDVDIAEQLNISRKIEFITRRDIYVYFLRKLLNQ